MNDPVVHFVADDLSVSVDLHQAGLDQPVHVRVQAAHARRELPRKHVYGPLGKVDRRAPGKSVEIERAAFRDVVRHVRDVHAEPIVAVAQSLDRDGIVEVPRVLAVDRDDDPIAEIGAMAQLGGRHRHITGTRLRDGIWSVLVGDAVLAQDDLGVDAGIVQSPEHLDDTPSRAPGHTRPAVDLDGHHVAVRGVEHLRSSDADIRVDPRIERTHERRARPLQTELPDEGRVAALDNLDHAAFGPPVRSRALDADDHAVAVHRPSAQRLRYEDIGGAIRVLGRHEREAAGVALEPASHLVNSLRERKLIAAHDHELAARDQRPELAPERRARGLWHVQQAREFSGRCRRPRPCAKGPKESVVVGHVKCAESVAVRWLP